MKTLSIRVLDKAGNELIARKEYGTPCSIGRRPDNDLILQDPSTSGKHARIEEAEGELRIVDQGSSNGIQNGDGEKIESLILIDTTRVKLGRSILEITVEEAYARTQFISESAVSQSLELNPAKSEAKESSLPKEDSLLNEVSPNESGYEAKHDEKESSVIDLGLDQERGSHEPILNPSFPSKKDKSESESTPEEPVKPAAAPSSSVKKNSRPVAVAPTPASSSPARSDAPKNSPKKPVGDASAMFDREMEESLMPEPAPSVKKPIASKPVSVKPSAPTPESDDPFADAPHYEDQAYAPEPAPYEEELQSKPKASKKKSRREPAPQDLAYDAPMESRGDYSSSEPSDDDEPFHDQFDEGFEDRLAPQVSFWLTRPVIAIGMLIFAFASRYFIAKDLPQDVFLDLLHSLAYAAAFGGLGTVLGKVLSRNVSVARGASFSFSVLMILMLLKSLLAYSFAHHPEGSVAVVMLTVLSYATISIATFCALKWFFEYTIRSINLASAFFYVVVGLSLWQIFQTSSRPRWEKILDKPVFAARVYSVSENTLVSNSQFMGELGVSMKVLHDLDDAPTKRLQK